MLPLKRRLRTTLQSTACHEPTDAYQRQTLHIGTYCTRKCTINLHRAIRIPLDPLNAHALGITNAHTYPYNVPGAPDRPGRSCATCMRSTSSAMGRERACTCAQEQGSH